MKKTRGNKRKTSDARNEDPSNDPIGLATTVLKKVRCVSTAKGVDLSPVDEIQAAIEVLLEKKRKLEEPLERTLEFPDIREKRTLKRRRYLQQQQNRRPTPTKKFCVGPAVVRVRGQDYWRRGNPDTKGSYSYVWFLYKTDQFEEPPVYVLKYETQESASNDVEIGRRMNKIRSVCPFVPEYVEQIDFRPKGEQGTLPDSFSPSYYSNTYLEIFNDVF